MALTRVSRTLDRWMPPALPFALLLAAGLLLVAAGHATPHAAAQTLSPGTQATVRADGGCLRVRALPGTGSDIQDCLPEGETLVILDGDIEADGFHWQLVRSTSTDQAAGWVAARYIEPLGAGASGASRASGGDGEVGTAVRNVEATTVLPVPVQGGITIGAAGVDDPSMLAEALPFEVQSISLLDPATQEWLTFIPGAPAVASSLKPDALEADSVVIVRRMGERPGALPPPPAVEDGAPALGVPNVLATPPPNGLTQGLSGTTDPLVLAAQQPFSVTSVSMFHVPSQRWLVFIPSAPAAVNTLHTGMLGVDSAVTIRRAPAGSAGQPASTPGSGTRSAPDVIRTVEASITYFYCAPGPNLGAIGDGGGWCGYFANGERVHAGGAACASRYLGQRFRIVGDPTGRTYTCADTGGAVFGEHRDVWFQNSDEAHAWWQVVGSVATIEVLSE